MAKRVILDVDPGIDDALAIILAVQSPELEIEAITTVGGNVDVDKTSKNAVKILENMPGLKRKIEVAKGLAKPLYREEFVTAEHVHGKDGLGDSDLPEPRLSLSEKHAVDLIIQKVLDPETDEMTLITVGPLSNVASALKRQPNIRKKIAQIVMMFGLFGLTPYGRGTVTPFAEFNVYNDPEAAKIVLESGIPITAVGLDVTMHPSARITRREYNIIKSAGTETAELVTRITENRMKSQGYLCLHDPMAVAVAIDPDLVGRKEYFVEVETQDEVRRGQTTVHEKKSQLLPKGRLMKPINVCTSVVGEKFLDLFMDRVVFRDA